MDILDLTEDQAAWLPGYEKAVLQWRLAKTSEDAKLAALLMWVIDFGNVSQLEKVHTVKSAPPMDLPIG